MRQFGRVLELKIGNRKESIVINNLRVAFSIKKTLTSEPNAGEISVYNLNDSNRNLITSKQYNFLELSVCYKEDVLRLIFCGDILTVENKQIGKDIITTMRCGDGHRAYTEKTIIKTMQKGQKDSDFLNEAVSSFGVQKGTINLPNDRALPRGKVLMCDTREAMHKIAINNNADWSIQDDQLVVIPKNKALANNEGWVISRNTGMIGSPKKSNDGLEITTLCNPHYRIGSLVRVESKLTEYNGDYKVKSIEHNGDLCGANWHSKLVCTGGKFEKV
ncbi:MAG: hypothetical protein J6583_07470 [Gilliamella sp.]|uniref:phage protein n=1 Tax=Gilliamella sp. TaxID=1891236 RepID=UPI0025EB151F|nr:hypothetical protein [Gilliamella sp.]MCO6545357.1 hypothetical protein [Gilliamella sp.]MCO6547601.1 hypothetical protein [Gilliamella sp.]